MIETRFAAGTDGTVPYRVDGDAGRDVLLVSDWGMPYGDPGPGAFAAFAATFTGLGARLVTLLDGTVGPRSSSVPETARRIAAARAVAEDAGIRAATVLGVADGAPVAAALVASGAAFAESLVLFDTFAAENRHQWGLDPDPRPSGVPAPPDGEDLRAQLKSADDALQWVRGLWTAVRSEVQTDPDLQKIRIPKRAERALRPLLEGDERWSGGIADLLQRVSQLEGSSPGSVSALGRINLPTLILEAHPATPNGPPADLPGLEVAAQIPGSRHRQVEAAGRWPWAVPELAEALLLPPAHPVPIGPARVADAAQRVLATVLFTDIVSSTEKLAAMGDAAWRDLLERHNAIVRGEIQRGGGREIDNAGDGFLASFEVPVHGVRCAIAIRDAVAKLGIAIRAGLHTGECEQVRGSLVGIAVHIGARIAAQAGPQQILVSAVVRDLTAGSGIAFSQHGVATLKGVPGEWQLYEVTTAPA